MFGIRSNSIGIMPAGALGVAFYHHLTANGQDGSSIVFLDRPGGDRREHPLGAGTLHIDYDSTRHEVPSGGLFAGGMIECYAQGRLPELILVAVNPDQIDALLGGIVQLLVWMRDQGALETDNLVFPYFLFVSNGIYFNHARYRYVEMLERAVMEGLLPDLWPKVMPQLVCRLLRGPTMQSGRRTGSGPDAVYQPGHQGLTMICGGDVEARQRVCDLLSQRRAPVQVAEQSPVSIELRKLLPVVTHPPPSPPTKPGCSTRSSNSPPTWSSPRHSGISQRWKTATGTPSADWCQADHYRMPPRSCRRYLLADLG